MKGIIVYESKSGATEAYARWLSEESGFPAVPARKAKRLAEYDLVVVGSCVRMYKPTLAGWIKARWPLLSGKKTVLFTVAGAPAADGKRKEWVAAALGDIASGLPHFPLDGKMKFADLPWLDRKLMGMAVKMTAKSNPEEAAKMGQEFDRVDRRNLDPLRQHLAGLGVTLKSSR